MFCIRTGSIGTDSVVQGGYHGIGVHCIYIQFSVISVALGAFVYFSEFHLLSFPDPAGLIFRSFGPSWNFYDEFFNFIVLTYYGQVNYVSNNCFVEIDYRKKWLKNNSLNFFSDLLISILNKLFSLL